MERRYESIINGSCMGEISEEKLCPQRITEKERLKGDWEKQGFYTTIYQRIEREFFPCIRYNTDSEQAWDILKSNFEKQLQV
ncbi:hypothetical protein TNIN_484261 [Trichonephila inaurata madagascariensis]|uniref:Uncharacterized protein n=1 Tax=Trichonephila inaurata madagascariensis TaxID=2747483 RepID=A0A8X6MHV6_9ARAC|nr:hypothetical protein TNIN_484261 [Trichonephila inaurata madagascariensis]